VDDLHVGHCLYLKCSVTWAVLSLKVTFSLCQAKYVFYTDDAKKLRYSHPPATEHKSHNERQRDNDDYDDHYYGYFF